ncbi:calcyphosin-like protein isoform X2 [Cydia pomonella]|uniref:calcyphosin-like protein isoform X2 n=1 Tax=Cydia pomonella TaxID=82600 RepID=UPI002ADE2113|nr:calcyphosin-like protein isoform X2 [Cydia pomonella]
MTYEGKLKTDSNIAWHRPQASPFRVEEELMQKSARALSTITDPVERLRLLCLTRGASGIMELGRIFRKMDHGGRKQLNKAEFFTGIKNSGLDLSHEPPMNDGRRAIVDRAFRKLDKSGDGVIATEDLRGIYSCAANPRYKSGEETEELLIGKFLANFESEGTVGGKVTLEEFINYYSGISVSMEDDCYFDLVMRQAYKL